MRKRALQKVTYSVMATAISISPVFSVAEIFATTPSELFNSETEGLLMEELTHTTESAEALLNETPIVSPTDSVVENTIPSENQVSPLAEETEIRAIESKDSTTFQLTDWKYTADSKKIVITGSKVDLTSVYIPAEFNGRQVILKDLNVFPSTMTHLTIGSSTGPKVGLQTTDLSDAFVLNKTIQVVDLRGLDTSKVTNMEAMFWNASSLKTLNMRGMDTSKVTDMSAMFYGCEALTYVNLTKINTSNVKYMGSMFSGVKSLTSLNLSSFNTQNVVGMENMFKGMESIKDLDLSMFDTSNVTRMNGMFSDMTSLIGLDTSSFDTSKVEYMNEMFANVKSLPILSLSNFETSNVVRMDGMFSGMGSVLSIHVKNLDTRKVTNMSKMFAYTESLTKLDLSSFKTSAVTDMEGMFVGSGVESLDLSHFNTSKVTDMSSMFSHMSNLKTLNVEGWNTTKVRNMSSMFSSCSSLTHLDLSSFETPRLTQASYMFQGMVMLNYLDLSQFSLAKVTEDVDTLFIQYTLEDTPKLFIFTNEPKIHDYNFVEAGEAIEAIVVGFPTKLSTNITSISGKASPFVSLELVNNTTNAPIASTTVDSSGNYELTFPKQANTSLLKLKVTKGSSTAVKNLHLIKMFKTFSVTTEVGSSTTAIYGKGDVGATVKIYNQSDVELASTTVNTNGNYKLVIPKQKAGTKLTVTQSKQGYKTVSQEIPVLYNLYEFSIKTQPTSSTTALYGTGVPGATVDLYIKDLVHLATTTVNSKGNYKLTFPDEFGGIVVSVKQSKSGYLPISKDIMVLEEFDQFTVNTQPTTGTTAIYGNGVAGSKVGIYTTSGKRLAITTVNSKGNYKLVIPKQKAGTVLTVKQAKSGYLTASKNITVLNEFKTFSVTTKVHSKTTAIYGKGIAGAKVGIYDKNGKRLAITTVNSKGNYKLTIPKQKVNTILTLKQAKSGYLTTSKTIKVLKG